MSCALAATLEACIRGWWASRRFFRGRGGGEAADREVTGLSSKGEGVVRLPDGHSGHHRRLTHHAFSDSRLFGPMPWPMGSSTHVTSADESCT